jgi:hypothetical protein
MVNFLAFPYTLHPLLFGQILDCPAQAAWLSPVKCPLASGQNLAKERILVQRAILSLAHLGPQTSI